MSDWKSVGVVGEGAEISVGGLNPWTVEWHRVEEEPIELPHPSYPNQRHAMWVYEAEGEDRRIQFAAGELSPNVWGFYLPVV